MVYLGWIGVWKIFLPNDFEGAHDTGKPIRLGQSPRVSLGSNDLLVGGISTPNQGLGFQGELIVSPMLISLVAGSLDQNLLRQYQYCGLH